MKAAWMPTMPTTKRTRTVEVFIFSSLSEELKKLTLELVDEKDYPT